VQQQYRGSRTAHHAGDVDSRDIHDPALEAFEHGPDDTGSAHAKVLPPRDPIGIIRYRRDARAMKTQAQEEIKDATVRLLFRRRGVNPLPGRRELLFV